MRKFFVGLLLFSSMAMYGCGGNGGGTSEPQTATGQFVDAPVAGLNYESGGQKGKTDANGNFTYEVGKSVKFSVGDIVLGEAPAQAVMTPIQLAAAGSTTETPEVVARVQFLMSISSTDPSTGTLTIPTDAGDKLKGMTIKFDEPSTVQAKLAELVRLIDSTKTVATEQEAMGHLAGSINKLMFSGKSFIGLDGNIHTFNSNGTYSSSDTAGTWTINSKGQIEVRDGGSVIGTVTLLSGDLTTALKVSVLNSDGTTSTDTLTLVTPVTTGFTTAMLSGKSFIGLDGNIHTFNSNGTYSSSDTAGTWAINSIGQIEVRAGGSVIGTVTLLSGDLSTALKVSVLNSDGTTSTDTLTLVTFVTSGGPVATTYTIDYSWTPFVATEAGLAPTNSLASILSFYNTVDGGGMLGGLDEKYGITFGSDGTVQIYKATWDETGGITSAQFVVSSTWKYVTIDSARLESNGTYTNVNLNWSSAILVDMSPVNTNDFFLVVYNGLVRAGSAL